MGISSLISEYMPQGLEYLGVGKDTANTIGKSAAPILSNAAIGSVLGAITGKPGTGALAGALNGAMHDKPLADFVNGPQQPQDENVAVTGVKGNLSDPTVQNSVLQSVAPNLNNGTSKSASGAPDQYSQSLGLLLALLGSAGNQRPPSTTPSGFNDHLMSSSALQRARGGTVNYLAQAGAIDNDDRRVRGQGDGTSDSIPASLSSGEYILSAADVSRIGQGDSEAGARRLDEMRKAIASDAGAKQHQPRVKHPIQYLQEASR